MIKKTKNLKKDTPYLTIEGRHNVIEALKSSTKLEKILIIDDKGFEAKSKEVLFLANKDNVKVEKVSQSFIDRLSKTKKSRGVMALARDMRFCSLEEIINVENAQLVVVLDGIQDPHNLGAIARSVEAFGGSGIVIRSHKAVGLTPGVVRASSGAISHLKIAKVSSVPKALSSLKQAGFTIVGAKEDAKGECHLTDFTKKSVLVIGGEHNGISSGAIKECDELVRIPIRGKVGSLNASVAASILIYETIRQRLVKR